jgi:hypothetical protein
MLTGLFWEVEHSAIYKPLPRLKDMIRLSAAQERSREVLDALVAFEEEFEHLVRDNEINHG